MLIQLRNASQTWLLKGVLGLIIITFVISFGVGSFTNSKEVLATVNGQEILLRDFIRRYEQQLADLRQRLGDQAETFSRQAGLKGRLLQAVMDETLYAQAARAQGLVVSAEELKQRIQSSPTFQSAGAFDYQRYQEILSANGIDVGEYENAEKETVLSEKYRRTILAGLTVGKKDISLQQRFQDEKVTVGYLKLDPRRIALKTAPITEKDIQANYDNHPKDYQTLHRTKIRYFTLNVNQLTATTQIDRRSVERYYEKNQDRFTTKGRVKIRQILKHENTLPANEKPNASQPTKNQSEQVLNGLRTQLLEKKASFSRLAKQHSDDSSKALGGELGWFDQNALLPEIAAVVFSMKKGELSQPIRTAFGWHLVEVQQITPPVIKPLSSVYNELLTELKNTRAERLLKRLVTQLPGRITKDGLKATATRFKRPLQNSAWLDTQSNALKLDSSENRAYQRLSAQKIDASGVIERNPLRGHIFYQITEAEPAKAIPLEKMRRKIAQQLKVLAQQQALSAFLKESVKNIKNDNQYKQFAQKNRVNEKQASFTAFQALEGPLSNIPGLQQKGFGLTKSNPFTTIETQQASYLIRFIRRTSPAEQPKKTPPAIRTSVLQQMARTLLELEILKLRKAAEIEILIPSYLES